MNKGNFSLRTFGILLASVPIFGCTYQSGYNPSFIPDDEPEFISDADVILFISEDQATLEYNESSTNFFASGTKLSIPLGIILREVSAEVLRDKFAGGIVYTNDSSTASRCCVTIAPSITRLDYRYSGWASGLLVELDLHVEFRDRSGAPFFSHTYVSGVVEERNVGGTRTQAITSVTADQFSAIVHREIYGLLASALTDARQLIIDRL